MSVKRRCSGARFLGRRVFRHIGGRCSRQDYEGFGQVRCGNFGVWRGFHPKRSTQASHQHQRLLGKRDVGVIHPRQDQPMRGQFRLARSEHLEHHPRKIPHPLCGIQSAFSRPLSIRL